ncbi:hypothetical protein D3C81_1300360 [compost metagenome]
MGRLLLGQPADFGHRQIVDQEAADGHFRAHVEEDRQHAEQHVRLTQCIHQRVMAPVRLLGGLGQRRQAEQVDEHRQQHQGDGQADIRALHRLRFSSAVSQLFGSGQRLDLIAALDRGAEDQQTTEQRRQRGAQRVERLGQREPARRGLLRPQQRDVRIGRHLQHGDAGRQHEQRSKEAFVDAQCSRRPETQRADAGNHQAGDDAVLVTQPRHQPAGRQRHQEIRTEEGELHQHRAGVVQLEHCLQVRNQHIVEAGQKAPHEEDGGGHGQRHPGIDHRGGRAGCFQRCCWYRHARYASVR